MAPRLKRRMDLGHPATWDDLDRVPETMIGEIVNGELVVAPRPQPPHAFASHELDGLLTGAFRRGIGGPGGWLFLAEPRIRFGRDIRVPDLAGWRKERLPTLPRRGPIPVVPDWICEVLSPSTAKDDKTTKSALYAEHKVGHLWLVSPEERTLQAFRLVDEGWLLAASHGEDERVRVPPFDAVEIDLSLLWAPLPDDEEDEE